MANSEDHDKLIGDIRARIGHPILDADAHLVEPFVLFLDELRAILGQGAEADFRSSRYHEFYSGPATWVHMEPEERQRLAAVAPSWWGTPINTPDRVAAYVPELLHRRLDRIGIDHALVYPSIGLGLPRIPESELRAASCRALNTYLSKATADFRDRLTPVAVIPTVTPHEAVAELDHAVTVLGMKAVMIDSSVDRMVPSLADLYERLGPRACHWDTYGIDSSYDYDVFWARCRDLGVAVTAHGGSRGTTLFQSVSNFSFNHMEHFAAAGQALAKSLVLGGVTRRFPDLNFACLEGGAAWGVTLLHSLVEHWEVRGLPGLAAVDPHHIDATAVSLLLDEVRDPAWKDPAVRSYVTVGDRLAPQRLDDFASCEAVKGDDIRALFAPRFWFGCEADDPGAAWAAAPPYCLNAMFGSDIGHFDVPDMLRVLPAAWTLVEGGLMTEEGFGRYAFSNAVRLHGGMNPKFFEGTTVESAAAQVLRATVA
ncbi:MAG: amidohydrolase family protein [Actinomycetota bacterium]|nr:amidohydrolase family protein [Actinomycetota bacterium]